ncbi:MAG: DNA adenine methylase [Kiritimatiellae bacterium]|nr:DNA adenine methylase [Kiritimatiellia bacterium]
MPHTLREESEDYLSSQILTYLGNKRALLRFIGEGVETVKKTLGKSRLSFFDAFSGSGIVSRFMKRHASLVIANDLERYSEVVNRCYLTNRSSVDWNEFEAVFRKWRESTLSCLSPGMIGRLYAPRDDTDIQRGERAFYTRENAVLLDSARNAIDRVVPTKFFALILAPLLAEASVHANTSGVFKGFYKNRRGIGEFGGEGRNARSRICAKIELRKPVLSNFECESVILRGDANEVVKSIEPVDLAYFDPPYNQHPYGSNYFMLNLLVDYKPPERVSKVAGIVEGWNRSCYNKRHVAEETFYRLLEATPAKYLLVSYNSEGFIPKDRLLVFLGRLGDVKPLEIEYNAFRGSRNLRARPLKVTEYLFLVRRK